MWKSLEGKGKPKSAGAPALVRQISQRVNGALEDERLGTQLAELLARVQGPGKPKVDDLAGWGEIYSTLSRILRSASPMFRGRQESKIKPIQSELSEVRLTCFLHAVSSFEL